MSPARTALRRTGRAWNPFTPRRVSSYLASRISESTWTGGPRSRGTGEAGPERGTAHALDPGRGTGGRADHGRVRRRGAERPTGAGAGERGAGEREAGRPVERRAGGAVPRAGRQF